MSKKDYPLIFIVEDNIAYSKIVEHHLKTSGFDNIYTFVSGEECLQYQYLKPDIIIQDYKLQGISGLHVLQQYKKHHPSCEFIFLSGQDDIDTAINAIKYGAYEYIVKNGNAMTRLVSKIDDIIYMQQLKQRNRNYHYIVFAFVIAILVLAGILIIYNKIFQY